MADKRKHIRVSPAENELIEIHIMGTGFLDIIEARDISEGGTGIHVPSRFEGCNIDAPVEIIITLPHTPSFKAKGNVKHINMKFTEEGIFGVEFTWIQTGGLDLIKKYVQKRTIELS